MINRVGGQRVVTVSSNLAEGVQSAAVQQEIMRDLRAMGAANPLAERRRGFLRRETLMKAAQIYAERFSDDDGRVRATFDLVWMSGWVPHESQQKPLKPGSAKMSLAEALKPK